MDSLRPTPTSLRPLRSRAVGALLLAIPLVAMFALAIGLLARAMEPRRPGRGEPAPALTGTTLDGRPFDLAGLEGQVVLIDFWATWCAGCTTWLPIAQRLQREYGDDGLVVVGASIEHDDVASVREVVAARNIAHPQLVVGPDAQSRFGTYVLPTYWLIDREGKVAGVWRGAFAEATARQAIEDALGDPARADLGL